MKTTTVMAPLRNFGGSQRPANRLAVRHHQRCDKKGVQYSKSLLNTTEISIHPLRMNS